MNPITTIIASVFSAVVAAFLVVTLMSPSSDDTSLEIDNADRILALENQLAQLEDKIGSLENELVTKDDLRAQSQTNASEANLNQLRNEIKKLHERLDADADLASSLSKSSTEQTLAEQPLTSLVDDRIKKIEAQKAAKAQAQKKKKMRLQAKIEAATRVAKIKKRLGLSQDQSDRLSEAITQQILARSGQWGILKNDTASPAERLAAIQVIRTSVEDFNQAAIGILSSTQYSMFDEENAKSENRINSWIDSIETRINGTGSGK